MAKKTKPPAKPFASGPSVTPERFSRLYRIIKMLVGSPQTREALSRN